MSRIQLTDMQWAFILLLLPPPARTVRPQVDDRRTIDGIVYVLITGCRWRDLPGECGASLCSAGPIDSPPSSHYATNSGKSWVIRSRIHAGGECGAQRVSWIRPVMVAADRVMSAEW
ncbi:MAG: transposase [Ktedonobacterales bacterium]